MPLELSSSIFPRDPAQNNSFKENWNHLNYNVVSEKLQTMLAANPEFARDLIKWMSSSASYT